MWLDSEVEIDADLVLVIEKDTVFRRLVQEQFAERHRCILITGRGMPDLGTRQFLAVLGAKFDRMLMLCVCDADLYGLRIFLQFKYGSARSLFECVTLTQLKWIGLSVLDILSLHLEQHTQRLNDRDVKMIDHLMFRPQIAYDAIVGHELSLMKQYGFKAELECLLQLQPAAFTPWIGLLVQRYFEQLQNG